MFKKPLLWVILLVGLIVLIISVVYAQPPRPRFLSPGFMEEVEEELELTDEQVDNIRDIQYDLRKEQIQLRADLKIAQLELKHLMLADVPKENEIFRQVEQIGPVKKELMRNDIERKLAIRKILTKSQFEKFLKMRGERSGWKEDSVRGNRSSVHIAPLNFHRPIMVRVLADERFRSLFWLEPGFKGLLKKFKEGYNVVDVANVGTALMAVRQRVNGWDEKG